jgi:alanine-glyoxylate transaminase/serine-glyoxylate transaminase/serine-pyruvate transaminase
MDAWGVDVTVAACQKGLMTPAGLSFVFYNEKANGRRGDNVTSYWDWKARTDPEVYFMYFNGTAPTHHLYGLREALDMIKGEGIENVWSRHNALAETIWTAFDVWGAGGPMQLNIAEPTARSHAVTSIVAGNHNGLALQNWCETQAGLTLGIGLGREPSHAYFRLGHMGHVNAHMIMGVLGTLEAGMAALKIPYGEGALAAAARNIALNAPAAQDGNNGVKGNCEGTSQDEPSQCC